MNYTQVRITVEYRDKLKALADANRRTMAQQLMQLIDERILTLTKEEDQ